MNLNKTVPKIGAAVVTVTVFLFAVCLIISLIMISCRKWNGAPC